MTGQPGLPADSGLVRPPTPTPLVHLRLAPSIVGDDEPYAFNPTLLATGSGVVCLYRTVDREGRRRVRRCTLDPDLQPTGPTDDWTTLLAARAPGLDWVADPRAFTALGRHFVSFNTGHSERPNRLFVVEVDEEGRPVAAPLEATRNGRRLIEKNWGFFEHAGELLAVYSLSPLVILRCVNTRTTLACEPAYRHDWHSEALEAAFGPLHGAACPVRVGDRLLAVCQCRTMADGLVYRGSVLAMEAHPPFAPVAVAPVPVFTLRDDERGHLPAIRLNPRVRECIYPSGCLHDEAGARLVLAYGINDYRAGLRIYRDSDVLACLRPVTAVSPTRTGPARGGPSLLRSFYWRPERGLAGTVDELSEGRFLHGNVGDALQLHLTAALFGRRTLHAFHGGRRLLGSGSIAHRAQAGDVIWGSGSKDVPLRLSGEERASITALAVRGPLTADYLAANGVDTSHVRRFLDPGLLIADAMPAQVAECRRLAPPAKGLLLVPHFAHTSEFVRRFPRHRIRSVDCDLFDLVWAVLGSELVVSSSLHGIIVAEALGVPALLMRPPTTEPIAKYHDYYLGTGRRHFAMIDDPSEASGARVPPPPAVDRSWRDDLPLLDALMRARLDETIHLLDDDPVLAIEGDQRGPQAAWIDAGRYLGDHFVLEVEVDPASTARVEAVLAGTGVSLAAGEAGSGTVTLIIDGAVVEAGGRLVGLQAIGGGGAPPEIRRMRARFPPW